MVARVNVDVFLMKWMLLTFESIFILLAFAFIGMESVDCRYKHGHHIRQFFV